MISSRRNQTHENTRDEIKAVSWHLLAEVGAPALSLGAIARSLGVTTPALYRYFKNRDALLTELIKDSYSSLTDALKIAVGNIHPDDHQERFRTMALTYHNWAAMHPQQYILMFGFPVPGYQLDPSAGDAADNSFFVLLELIDAADRAGKIKFTFDRLSGVSARLRSVKHLSKTFSEKITYLALVSWSFLHGMTSLELGKRYSLILADQADEFVSLEVERFIQSIGLQQ